MTAIPLNEKIPVIKGLNLTNNELKKATEENKMLLLDAETSNVCNLNCRYCFRDVYGTKEALKNELSLTQRLELFRQAKYLGCKTIKITGAGEPLIDPCFEKMVDYANKLGMWVICFTNGFVIDKKLACRFYKKNLSLIVKCNSKDPEIEDYMAGRDGYAQKRNKSIEYLIEVGFNKSKPTRLGMDAVITKQNKDQIINSLRYCRKNNIFPLFRPMMPIGGAIKVKDWEINKEEVKRLHEDALKIDKKEFGLGYNLTLPYMGGVWCRQLHYALYVNILGEVYTCTGSKKLLGNIKKQSLKEIWNNKMAKKIRSTPYDSCPLRESYWKGKKDYDCI